jgi:cobalt-zinc-cadmium efflux system membrane fusion protein
MMISAGKLSRRWPVLILLTLLSLVVAIVLVSRGDRTVAAADPERDAQQGPKQFRPSSTQWQSLTVEPVAAFTFRSEHLTEGKIAVDEDRSTPVFSLYAGRVTRLLVAPGDTVQRGQPLFVLEAGDTVQAQNDYIAALTALNKARSQVQLAETVERRLRNLHEAKAMPLKDWQEAQANLTASQNDLRTAQTALEAMRNRLRLLGKSDAEIDAFQRTGAISPEATVSAPISGTVVQRKVGPGQYITAGSNEPVFVIGDLSTVWLVAFVRESEASKVKVGQPMRFKVLAYPDRSFEAKTSYVAPALDPSTRRLTVRATVDNSEGLLRPEMFASVAIVISQEGAPTAALPREAIIYEGDAARVWVAVDGAGLEARQVKLGLSNGQLIQVLDGLKVGEKVVTRGSLFVDRATGS